MSCFIVSEETLNIIADFIETQLSIGFNATGISDDGYALQKAFADCKPDGGDYSAARIYNKLYAENIKAYSGRYNRAPVDDYITPYRGSNLFKHDKFARLLLIHKKLACYLYQITESATADGAIYGALHPLENELAHNIVYSLPEHEAIAWG